MMRLYVIKDTVADEFGPVFEAKNDEVATRSFKALISKAIQPSDFVLFFAGVKGENGVIQALEELMVVDIYIDLEVVK